MPISIKGKSKYVTSLIDGSVHCLSNGKFSVYLAKLNMSLSNYVEKYEPVVVRPICRCGNLTPLIGTRGTELTWAYSKSCGSMECAKRARAEGISNMTPEKRKEKMGRSWKTLNADPERKAKAITAQKTGNQVIGVDGLTGYERTAKKRAETLLNKYGRPDYANWEKASRTKKDWTDGQREENSRNRSRAQMLMDPEVKKLSKLRRKETNILRHNMECPANKSVFHGYSKLASSLFEAIDLERSEFKPKTREFCLLGKIFDFRIGKKLIEFNGDYWHANPKKYDSEFLVGRNGKRKASEIWAADKAKIELAERNGYQVKVIWESEYKRTPTKIIEECRQWIQN